MGTAIPPALSVVAITDDETFVRELEDTLAASSTTADIAVELLVASTKPQRSGQHTTVATFPLESAYRRNRGLLAARGSIVAFLEHGQLPSSSWLEAIVTAFGAGARPAAAVGGPRRSFLRAPRGGNVAYDRLRLVAAHGFPLFTGAPPGSPVPDLLVLAGLAKRGETVVAAPRMTVAQERLPPLDARRVGRSARLSRQPALAARAASAALRRGSLRDLIDLLAGGLVDRDWRSTAPDATTHLPPAVAATLGQRKVTQLQTPRKGKLHFLYRAEELMLHLYVAPSDHLREAITAHEAIRTGTRAAGIPRVHVTEEALDSIWLVEDFVDGEPLDTARLHREADRIGSWIVELGGAPGPALGTAPSWRAHADNLLAAGFPEPVHAALSRSLAALEGVPARHLHGDLNPRNVLDRRGELAAVDWENAAEAFVPGLDLVFLFLIAAGTPDEALIRELARPEARQECRLFPFLQALGLDQETMPHALRVMLATWALGERRRRSRLGVDPRPVVFEPLFLRSEKDLI